MSTPTYEEGFGSLARRLERLRRHFAWKRKTRKGEPRDLLVELRWRLGDEIMALPILHALRAQYPRDRIGVLTNYPDLFLDSPDMDAVNDMPRNVDRYVLLKGASRLVPRTDAYAASADIAPPCDAPRLHYCDWHCGLLDELPDDAPIVAVAAGTTWPTKRWPLERWRALCRRLEQAGAYIVELGRDDEPIGVGHSLMNRTSIREAACVLHRARLLVSCDSGLMHLAMAAGTPAVALFGPTDPAYLVINDSLLVPLCSALPCAGLWNHAPQDYDPNVCPHGHASCLEDIDADRVYNAAATRAGLA